MARCPQGAKRFTWNRVIHPDGHSEDVMSILLQPEQINSLMSAYASLKESAYAGLVLGTRLSDYLSGLTLTYSNDAFGWDASALRGQARSHLAAQQNPGASGCHGPVPLWQ